MTNQLALPIRARRNDSGDPKYRRFDVCTVVVLKYGEIWFQAYMSSADVDITAGSSMTSLRTNATMVARENPNDRVTIELTIFDYSPGDKRIDVSAIPGNASYREALWVWCGSGARYGFDIAGRRLNDKRIVVEKLVGVITFESVTAATAVAVASAYSCQVEDAALSGWAIEL